MLQNIWKAVNKFPVRYNTQNGTEKCKAQRFAKSFKIWEKKKQSKVELVLRNSKAYRNIALS